MTGSRWGWMLALPVLAVPLLPHAGGASLVLVAALLATIALVRQAGVRPAPAASPGFRRPGTDAGADCLRTPIRSCDPDGRGHPRPRAPGRSGLPRA